MSRCGVEEEERGVVFDFKIVKYGLTIESASLEGVVGGSVDFVGVISCEWAVVNRAEVAAWWKGSVKAWERR